ncbi:F-actin-capping protein subunit alpha [Lipomyces chichibuensis]|uniref:F-actin-capping protein subunit alpha n=1 Tax=Lipomyces chichibuensis TaxID=1546026 RepID=UPI003343EE7A
MSVHAKIRAASEFLDDAPPGEVKEVYQDIKSIVEEDSDIIDGLESAFEKYNLSQFVTVKLPGAEKAVIVSKYNSLGSDRFYDSELGKSFTVDHRSLKVSDVDEYDSAGDVVSSITGDVKHYVSEHYPDPSSYGVFPQSSEDDIAIVIVGNKYSPFNFWNGRWRSSYIADLASGSLTGTIAIDVHYYEDGNVRLKTTKQVESDFPSAQTSSIIKSIAALERSYQEELNHEFGGLSDGAFKSLRRQLPVTRSKIEWGKAIGAYRLGQDIGGGRSAK